MDKKLIKERTKGIDDLVINNDGREIDGLPVLSLKEWADNAIEKGATHFYPDVEGDGDYGSHSVSIQAYNERLETDEEFKERLDRMQRCAEQNARTNQNLHTLGIQYYIKKH